MKSRKELVYEVAINLFNGNEILFDYEKEFAMQRVLEYAVEFVDYLDTNLEDFE
jgi:hypothetical protein